MRFIQNQLKRWPEYKTLSDGVKAGRTPAAVTGLSGIHKCCVIASLCRETGRKALVLAADEAEAQRFSEDLFALGLRTVVYPLRDLNYRDAAGVSHEYERLRLDALSRLQRGSADCVIACVDAALQLTLGPEELSRRLFQVEAGQELSQEDLLAALVQCGYVREDQIEGPGQFSRRGGIVDFFSPGDPQPVRVEFWGDEVDSVSYFDLKTQRRTDPAGAVTLAPCVEVIPQDPRLLAQKIQKLASSLRGKHAPKAKEILRTEAEKLEQGLRIGSMDKFLSFVYPQPATLLDYFSPEDSLFFYSEGNRLKERMRTALWQWGEDLKAYLEEGVLCKGLDKYSEDWEYALSQAERVPTLFLDVFARGSYEVPTKALVNMTARQLPVWGGGAELLAEDLSSLLSQGRACAVLAGTERAAKAVAEDLKSAGLPAAFLEDPSTLSKGTVTVTTGSLSAGFDLPGAAFALITHGRMLAPKAKRAKKDKNSKEISSLSELSPGDYVVHSAHGIGVFEGIHKLEMNGVTKDYIKVRYQKNDTLYVPVTQLDMVSKYIGPREDAAVKLSRLGGTEWQKQKTRVRAAVKDIAKELIQLYAQRMQTKGFPFPPDGEWQRDFESRFEFDETEDQLRCIQEIKDDMEAQAPMDRLLCGDVGFGKTEVALRAAFKCVAAGKQCAILVPTTILAWQHYQTILKRMEGFPVDVELLSRFRTSKQQDQILRKVKRGSIDIVVGTHRLVSKDVKFHDLGLVIIDEEQRFGVAQKEKLKQMCQTADVLTLSATPIPRTLNMALSGIRDMSTLEEPPSDRQPVQTYVLEHDWGVLSDAMRRELERGGQVYYLHNRVDTITRTAARIRELLGEDVTVAVAHGKMSQEELNDVMTRMSEGEVDVLVCTTIIETGIDIANANTLIIEDADKMGLAQLHQIRGRVGRSSRRAYAYLTFRRGKVLSEVASKRLGAIREFAEFGSGFKIAMRDLEIRGAGNVLGPEQSGFLMSVGYDLYLKLLEEAVLEERGEKAQIPAECSADLSVAASIPDRYVPSPEQRMDLYRRIAAIRSEADADDLTDELIDRYGDPPRPVNNLIAVALMRAAAAGCGITEISQKGLSLLFYLDGADLRRVSALCGLDKYRSRLLFSAGEKPYLSLRLKKGDDPLKLGRKLVEEYAATAAPQEEPDAPAET